MNTETWKPVKGFEKYEVSNFGRVRSMRRRGQTEWHVMSPVARNKDDARLYVMLRKNGKSHAKYVARMVADAFTPSPTEQLVVGFKDGDKTNNRLDNLEWVELSKAIRATRKINGTFRGAKNCTEAGCRVPAKTKGYCQRHYYAQHRKNVFGTGVGQHKKQIVGYEAAHERVRRAKGLVDSHTCECGQPATQWSLRVDAPKPFVQANGRSSGLLYSLDVEDYSPMCIRCHSAYDAKNRQAFKALHATATKHVVTENPLPKTKEVHAQIVKRVKETGSLSIVAEEVGYDISYVSRAFANAEGINFRQWMKGAAA